MRDLRPRGAFAAFLVAAVVLTSCGFAPRQSGGAGGSDAGADISFLVFGDPEELQAYRNVISAFEEREPETDVTLVEASDRSDLIARLSTSFAGGEPPDLFLINYRFFGQFASRGVLEPIESRLESSSAFEPDDFYPQALDAFRFGGDLVCLPQNISSLVVYYNRDLLRAAGLSDPASDWTWTNMVEGALALTSDTDGDGTVDQHGLGVEPSVIRLAPFVWSNGGELFDDEDAPTRFALDTPETREALELFFDLGRLPGLIPNEQEVESEDLESRFMNGRLAMLLSSRRATPTFRTITDFDWDVAPLPRHREPAGILHSDAYCMTAASRDKDAAWRFMEFALGPEGQRVTATSGRTVPSLIDVSTSEAFLDPEAQPANSRVFVDTIPYIRRVPNISTWPEIEDAAEPIIEEALYEGLPVDVFIQRLEGATTEIFARAER